MAQTLKRSALVPYSVEEMYGLVEDVDRYQDFLNWCSSSSVDSRETLGGEEIVTASVEISWHGVNKQFTTRNRLDRFSHIRMELVEGPFSELTGDWHFTPLGESGCRIEFDLVFEFSNRLIGRLVGPVFKEISDGQVDAFHRRAVKIYGPRSLT